MRSNLRSARSASLAIVLALVVFTLAAGGIVQAAPPGTFSGNAEAAALGLQFLPLDQGLTLGVSNAEATSDPSALARGAGTCEVLAPGNSIAELPCTETNEVVAGPAPPNDDPPEACDDAVPPPLGDVLTLQGACGDALAEVTGADPLAEGEGKVGRASLATDLSPLSSDLDAAVDEVIDTLLEVLPPTPANPVIEALRDGTDAAAIELGPSTSLVSSEGNIAQSIAQASGATLGILAVPCPVNRAGQEQEPESEPSPAGVPGPAGEEESPSEPQANNDLITDAITHGLVIIRMAETSATATWDGGQAQATGEAEGGVVEILVRDLEAEVQGECPQYMDPVPVLPGDSVTLFPETPIATTISVFDPQTEESNTERAGTASAEVDGVFVHALQGLGATENAEGECGGFDCDGGLVVQVATSRAFIHGELPAPPPELPPPLATTGITDLTAAGLLALIAALLIGRALRRRPDTG
jgi:hypothetical protein